MTKPGKYTKRALEYEEEPQQIRHREERNQARRTAEKAGKAVAGKDVAHIHPLAGGGSPAASNIRVEAVAKNRSWRRGQKGYRVPEDK